MSGDPYTLLGVSEDADLKSLKRAYKTMLRKHRPEKDPAGFQRVREA